ncbi:DUF4956 domain-containing protein [Pelagibacteraceae bacterium]|jgi:hypothetical protein|nr:DUF4956 domain-containing protein [Pelagibacteraceae bacterium]|tara:strand:+ start:1711 stop:2328 length:618 start_codon:yes stop_codon:yes gene_type:complete
MVEINSLLLLILGGLILRFSLTATGQGWAKSHAQTVSFMILPVITYVITKTISGNIALSLGMIGALSIVRFRHPVKSALELIMYFDLITIGIATSVRTKWAIQLILCTVFIIFSAKLIQKILQKYGKSFYRVSFNEGMTSNTIEISCDDKIDDCENSDHLVNSINDKTTNEIIYRFMFENKDQLNLFKKKIENSKNIKRINVDFV